MRGTGDGKRALEALDLFAGPGGWDEGIRELGIEPLGIEWDDAACATREARGMKTLQADVSELDPEDFEAELLIASPPCQAFSAAGKGDGYKDVPAIMATARALAEGRDIRGEVAIIDPRSLLVVEPLRWALALHPTFVACEQVPGVLTLWRVFAEVLRDHGYSCWTGLLTAEAYGVPQTRERAFLMASRAATVAPPEPTHQTYVFGEPAAEQHTFTGTLAPWISMAQALGWDEGSAEYRLARGEGMLERHGQRPNTPDDRPAPVMTSKARTATWIVRTGQQSRKTRQGPQEPFERDVDAPAPTVMGSSDRWMLHRPAPTVVTTRRSKDGLLIGRQMAEGEGENVGGWGWNPRQNGGTVRDGSEPAPTILAEGLAKGVPVWDDERNCPKAGPNAVRVTLQEAAILQGFPPDYPFQGSRTKCFEQVGNAVPPPLAFHVVRALVGDALAVAA